MSHHEEAYHPGMWEMMTHFERVLYTPAFKAAYESYFGTPFDWRRLTLWLGEIGPRWLKPGKAKKYITLVLNYHPTEDWTGPVLVVYEQDDPRHPEGVFQAFAK